MKWQLPPSFFCRYKKPTSYSSITRTSRLGALSIWTTHIFHRIEEFRVSWRWKSLDVGKWISSKKRVLKEYFRKGEPISQSWFPINLSKVRKWWEILESNQWPHACHARALTNWANPPSFVNMLFEEEHRICHRCWILEMLNTSFLYEK